MDTNEKDTLFLFDSFGSYALLNFIVNNDLDVFKRVIPGQIKKIFKKDYKIMLLKWSFKFNNYEKLKQMDKLTPAARHFFKFLYDFGKYKKIKNTVKLVTVGGNLQSFDIDYCGPFQMYLYLSLFKPLKGSVVVESSSKKLNVKLIGEMLNEIFNTSTRQNERVRDAFILQHDIKFDGEDVPRSVDEMEEEEQNCKLVFF